MEDNGVERRRVKIDGEEVKSTQSSIAVIFTEEKVFNVVQGHIENKHFVDFETSTLIFIEEVQKFLHSSRVEAVFVQLKVVLQLVSVFW